MVCIDINSVSALPEFYPSHFNKFFKPTGETSEKIPAIKLKYDY